MKKVIFFAAFILTAAVSFISGRTYESEYYNVDSLYEKYLEYKDFHDSHVENKDYEAACLQADFIRYLIDHFCGEKECADIGMEIEECYYEFFDGLDLGQFKTKSLTLNDLNNYYWCY